MVALITLQNRCVVAAMPALKAEHSFLHTYVMYLVMRLPLLNLLAIQVAMAGRNKQIYFCRQEVGDRSIG